MAFSSGETVSSLVRRVNFWPNFPIIDEEIRIVEIDKTRSENVRRWWPFFRDRRIDAFGGLTERFLI